jgi:hypothetical protein
VTGVTAIMAGIGGGGPVYLIKSDIYFDQGIFGVDPSAGVTFTVGSGGTVTAVGDIAGSLDSYNWIDPTTGSTTHYVRATLTSGTFSSGTAGSWLALTSDRAWYVGVSSQIAKSATATFEIATDAGGTNIVASGTVTLSAELV